MSENEMSGSLAVLRDIFLDPDVSRRDRIKAVEVILTYENPAQLVQQAKDFLEQLCCAVETPMGVRLEALKVMRKAEAKKITQPTVTGDDNLKDFGERLEAARKRAQQFAAQRRASSTDR